MKLTTRVKQLERQAGADGKYVLIPLPGQEGQSVRLPRAFAEWLARAAQDDGANLTDRLANHDDGIRHNPTD